MRLGAGAGAGGAARPHPNRADPVLPGGKAEATLPMAVSDASGDSPVDRNHILSIRIERNDALKWNVHAQLGPATPITFLLPKR
jgi:hypothetical protein